MPNGISAIHWQKYAVKLEWENQNPCNAVACHQLAWSAFVEIRRRLIHIWAYLPRKKCTVQVRDRDRDIFLGMWVRRRGETNQLNGDWNCIPWRSLSLSLSSLYQVLHRRSEDTTTNPDM